MGTSERHAVLLAVLLGEDEATQTLERRETQIYTDGEKTYQEVETIRTYKS
jgi:hypothetical protein